MLRIQNTRTPNYFRKLIVYDGVNDKNDANYNDDGKNGDNI